MIVFNDIIHLGAQSKNNMTAQKLRFFLQAPATCRRSILASIPRWQSEQHIFQDLAGIPKSVQTEASTCNSCLRRRHWVGPNVQVHFVQSSHSHFLDAGHWHLSALTVLLESQLQRGKYEGTNGLISYPYLFNSPLQSEKYLVSSQSIYASSQTWARWYFSR